MVARRHARSHRRCHPRSLGRAIAVLSALAWCSVALHVAVEPDRTGPVEQGLALSGWTISLVPVHVAPLRRVRPGGRTRRAEDGHETGCDGAGPGEPG